MKKLLITLMLISPFSFADWGDVYYCQMTTNSQTTLEGKRTDYILDKFQFKLDKTKGAMVFGGGLFFDKSVLPLSSSQQWPSGEAWYAKDAYSVAYFDEGKLVYVTAGISGSTSISADCDKF